MIKVKVYLLTVLRMVVGWHFLYEGISKLMTSGWSAQMYLMGSKWIFADIFHWMASSPHIMGVVDFLNIWGLILIGFSLFIGLLSRWSAIAGSVLLLFYFVAYPPIPGYTLGTVVEGSYLLVNKTLVEFFMLLAFAVLPVELFYGADSLIKTWKEEKAHAPIPSEKKEGVQLQRRKILRNLISVPFLGAFAYAVYKKKQWDSFEEKFLVGQPDATSGATTKSFSFASLSELKGQVPKVKIGNVEFSRLIMGGNLIAGFSHARDLLYTSKLVKAYHTDERVMMTLQLAEKCSINTILTTPRLGRIINKYWHETGGKIQLIADCGGYDEKKGWLEGIEKAMEVGASAIYVHGAVSDRLVQQSKTGAIAEALELIRNYGKPAGIGGHLLETVQGCINQGIKPDFWMKTLHHLNYWSAQVDLERKRSLDLKSLHSDPGYSTDIDSCGVHKPLNMYCNNPQETIDYMESLDEPWIAFKVLSAGAIHPKDSFRYSFENGADILCVGMYDFQMVEDCNLVYDIFNSDIQGSRKRRWLA